MLQLMTPYISHNVREHPLFFFSLLWSYMLGHKLSTVTYHQQTSAQVIFAAVSGHEYNTNNKMDRREVHSGFLCCW